MKFILPALDQLTAEQKALVAIDLDAPERQGRGENMVVKGYGGTGKTVVACHRALKLSRQGKRTLFLCFNKALKDFIQTESLNSDFFYLDQFYRRIRDKLQKELLLGGRLVYADGEFLLDSFSFKENLYYKIIYRTKNNQSYTECLERDWYLANVQQKEFLEVLFGWYKQEIWSGNFLYDEIYIDEAQDLSADMLEALKMLTPHFAIFADENQKIFEGSSSIETIAHIFFPNVEDALMQVEELTVNMRSTKEIVEYAAEYFLPKDESAKMMTQSAYCRSLPDSLPEEQSLPDKAEQLEQLREWIQKSIIRGSLAIFCRTKKGVREISALLTQRKLNHGFYYSGVNKKETRHFAKPLGFETGIFVSTYHSSKGTEADTVIMIIDEKTENEFNNTEAGAKENNLLYVLATRAKKKLYVLFTSE